MANGRPLDDRSRRSSRKARTVANQGGLESLSSRMGPEDRPGTVANEKGLRELGSKIDQAKGRRRRRSGTRAKPRRTFRQRLLRVAVAFVALLVVVAAAGYGFFRYESDKIDRGACTHCTSVASGAPYNVLVIGSDTRVGETAAEAKEFGNQTNAGGQRSDTIKIIHVDPQTDTASTLSLPRDTLVTLSGVPAASGVSNPNKLNAAFATGPNDPKPNVTGANGLVQTIQNTFGIPISHWIVVNFFGLMDAVNALDGVSMDVPYPVQDYGDCNENGVFENCTGLDIQKTGCQVLSGATALSLSRSRHFEWYQDGQWQSDESGDIGRIERQDLLIEAVVDKAKSTYNPLRALSFINSVTHDVTLDNNFSTTSLLSLAEQYHAFSGSALKNYTLPTSNAAFEPYGGESVQIVDEPQATEMITQFLGTAPNTPTTPPLDQYGNPLSTAVPATTATVPSTGSSSSSSSATTVPGVTTNKIPYYDPRPC